MLATPKKIKLIAQVTASRTLPLTQLNVLISKIWVVCFPFLGASRKAIITHASKGAPKSPNPPSASNSKLPQHNKLSVLALDHISTSLNTSKDLQPLHSQPMISPQLYSNCHTASNDCNEYPDLDALPIVSDFDLLPDILDFDQFHEWLPKSRTYIFFLLQCNKHTV
jgi:hypothetical protein